MALERCKRGDQNAWASLVSAFQEMVYSIPRRMGLGEDDASDVFQAVFLALYRSLDRLESGNALPKWLSTTAARESLRAVRARSLRTGETSVDWGTLEELVADEQRNAEELSAKASDAFHVRAGMQKLPAKCRELLHSLFFSEEEPSYQQISKETGVPVGAIGPTRARCLEKLRKLLVSEGFFE